jgi:hypothetical protein
MASTYTAPQAATNSHNSDSQVAMGSLFLDLPQEMRDMVFDCLPLSYIWIHSPRRSLRNTNGVALASTCRQLYREYRARSCQLIVFGLDLRTREWNESMQNTFTRFLAAPFAQHVTRITFHCPVFTVHVRIEDGKLKIINFTRTTYMPNAGAAFGIEEESKEAVTLRDQIEQGAISGSGSNSVVDWVQVNRFVDQMGLRYRA